MLVRSTRCEAELHPETVNVRQFCLAWQNGRSEVPELRDEHSRLD